MRTYHLLLPLLIGIMLVSSCDIIDEVTSFDVPVTFESELDVVVPPGRGPVDFYASTDIDPTANGDYSDYINRIEEIEIVKLSGTVIDISKNIILNSATLRIYDLQDNAQWSFTNLPVSEGTVLTLDNSSGQWNTIANILEKDKVFFTDIEGQASEGNVSFSILIENEVKLKGNL